MMPEYARMEYKFAKFTFQDTQLIFKNVQAMIYEANYPLSILNYLSISHYINRQLTKL